MKNVLLMLALGMLVVGCEKQNHPNESKKSAELVSMGLGVTAAPSGKVYVPTVDELEKLMPKYLCSTEQKILLKKGEDCISRERQQAWLEKHREGKK